MGTEVVRDALRSPRAKLGGYVILPRLIDKVRLAAQGRLPPDYQPNLLKPGLTLDGRFLTFTGLDAEQLRKAILATRSDDEVLVWVQTHARPHSEAEKEQWARQIEDYRPDATGTAYRRRSYPQLAEKLDLSQVSVFDLIDWDEGRLSGGMT